MFNFLKSTFTHTSANSEAEALVEEFAKQDGRLYPFDLKNFTAGVKFQNAETEIQRAAIMAILSWFVNHTPTLFNVHNRKAVEVHWKMSQVFLHMLKHKLPYSEQEVTAILDWAANKSQYVYYRGMPQVIKIVSEFLKENDHFASCSWRYLGRYRFKRTARLGFKNSNSMGRASPSLFAYNRFRTK